MHDYKYRSSIRPCNALILYYITKLIWYTRRGEFSPLVLCSEARQCERADAWVAGQCKRGRGRIAGSGGLDVKKQLLIAGVLASIAFPQPSNAQVEAIFGIMEQMMREGARQQQTTRERERRQQEIYRQHEAQLALNRRAQAALKELGFYTMAIDGQVGPGTRRAIADYIRAFEMPDRPLTENDITILESRAQAGFRSLAETREAQSGGFMTRRDWKAASAAGFPNAREWEAGRREGVADYQAWRRFRSSGFAAYREFEQARERGFETRRALERAERAGFETAEDYAAFVESGAPDRETFERQRERLDAARLAREGCLEAVSERDWPIAAPVCRQAATVLRNDDALISARATAERQLDLTIAATGAERERLERRLDDAKDALRLAESDLENLVQGSADDSPADDVRAEAEATRDQRLRELEELAQALADADAGLERAERGRLRATCFGEREAQRWTAAVAACMAALNADPGDEESAENLAIAKAEGEAERLRAEEERRTIALRNARRESAQTIEALDSFAAAGGVFEQGLAVTRAVVNLKAALDNEAPEPLLQARQALTNLLAEERAFQSFRQARRDAERAAEASALAQAEENARRLEAFLRDYLARNVLSPHAMELLELQARLEEVLTSDDSDRIIRSQAEAMAQLDTLGLGQAARAFTLTPRVAASDLRAQEERAAQARLTLVTARAQAAALLTEVEDFVATGARFDAAIPVARGVSALRAAQAGEDIAALEDARRALSATLDDETAFAGFRARRAEAEAVATSDGTLTAAARLARKQAFIEDYIAGNPLDANMDALLAAYGDIADALDAGIPARLALTLDEKRALLSDVGLVGAYERHAAMAANPSDDDVVVRQAPGGLAITALNEALLGGDPRDILALRNVSGSAPHLRLNLRGEPVFEAQTARLCWMHAPPEPAHGVNLTLHELRLAGARNLVGGRRCQSDRLLEQDLVLLERGRFLEGDVLAAQALTTLFEEEKLRPFSSTLWVDVAEESARLSAFVAGLREELAAGARAGVGFIALPGSGDALCIVDAGADEHARALQAHLVSSARDEINLHLIAPLSAPLARELRDDAERVFARAGRGECGAIMADGETLDPLLNALARDGMAHHLTPIWFEAERVAEAREAVIAEDGTRLRQLAAMRQSREAEALLRREQRSTAEALRQAREEELRVRHGQEARGAFNDLQGAAYAIVDSNVLEDQARSLFPEFRRWREAHLADGWEFIDREAELVDFGLADWDDRRLEAVVIRVGLESRNPVLGRYEQTCIVMGYLIDTEFERRRDAFEVGCAGAAAIIEDWQKGRNFTSRWVARLEE